MEIIGYGSGDDGRDYLPLCPYCGMEMMDSEDGCFCVNPECETYTKKESEEGDG